MEKKIEITNIEKGVGYATINFVYSDSLSQYFRYSKFIIESDIDFNLVPDSIIKVPFVCNVLPIIWLTDTTLVTGKLDQNFYDSIDAIKQGYMQMYPMLDFKGCIKCQTENNATQPSEKTLCLFSGGVDACTTALRHLQEPMILMSVWGSADHPLDDWQGWEMHERNLIEIANNFGKQLITLRSNFYTFIDNWGNLNRLIKASGESWWHGFQHGIGLISLAAPIAFLQNVRTVYIAASFTKGEKVTCASDPTIDNNLKFNNTNVVHDGYELTRQEKVAYLVHKAGDIRIPMHVCLRPYQNEQNNCCKCEKCYRTILAILAEGGNPANFGFRNDLINTNRIISDIKYRLDISYPQFYLAIQNAIKENAQLISDKTLLDFAKYPNDKINNNFLKRLRQKIEKSRIHPILIKLLHWIK